MGARYKQLSFSKLLNGFAALVFLAKAAFAQTGTPLRDCQAELGSVAQVPTSAILDSFNSLAAAINQFCEQSDRNMQQCADIISHMTSPVRFGSGDGAAAAAMQSWLLAEPNNPTSSQDRQRYWNQVAQRNQFGQNIVIYMYHMTQMLNTGAGMRSLDSSVLSSIDAGAPDAPRIVNALPDVSAFHTLATRLGEIIGMFPRSRGPNSIHGIYRNLITSLRGIYIGQGCMVPADAFPEYSRSRRPVRSGADSGIQAYVEGRSRDSVRDTAVPAVVDQAVADRFLELASGDAASAGGSRSRSRGRR
jgi:hypothetical protein